MGTAIAAVLVPAAGVALSPILLVAVILVLFTPRAARNGVLFAAGFVAGLAALAALVLALAETSGVDGEGDAATAAYVVRIAAGLVLVLLAARKARGALTRRASGDPAGPPGWMSSIDRLGPGGTLGLGAGLGGVNPKNVVFTLAAAASIAQAGLGTAEEWSAMAVYVCLASGTVVALVGYRLAGGDGAAGRLDRWRVWLAANDAAVMAALFAVFGVLLVGEGISGLV